MNPWLRALLVFLRVVGNNVDKIDDVLLLLNEIQEVVSRARIALDKLEAAKADGISAEELAQISKELVLMQEPIERFSRGIMALRNK